MFTQVMGVSDIETDGMEMLCKTIQDKNAKITGIDDIAREITDREWRHGRRAPHLKKDHRNYLPIGLALAVIACMTLICAVSYSTIKAQANTGFKYYTSITVDSGETLWSIADRYIDYEHYKDKNAYIAEVERINHLEADEIILAGQLLIVPYYSIEYIQ